MTQPSLAHQRSLFLQALAAMQATPWQDVESYFQLAAIHGIPYMAYDGAVNPESPYVEGQEFLVSGESYSRDGGYCPHLRVTFPTWHRAQLLSFEAVVRKRALEIAQSYAHRTDAAQWCAAAHQLALPYFDWASLEVQRTGLPAFFEQRSVTVDAPSGRKTIPNPLKGYTIPSAAAFPPYGSCTTPRVVKKRVYTCTTWRGEAQDITEALQQGVQQQRFDIAVFMASNTWSCMSNADITAEEAQAQRCNGQASLEAVHDFFHETVGGWMPHVPHASFDPIFWLHHAFVDKLFALWQLENPTVGLSPQLDLEGTYWYPPGTVVNSLTPLAPFRVPGSHRFYNSNEMRDWRGLGYTYDNMVNEYAALLEPDPRKYFHYFVVLPAIDRNQLLNEEVTVRVFILSPGATAATPTDGNPNFAGTMTWLQRWEADEEEERTRVQLDLTPALHKLGRTKLATQEAADPTNLAKGPALSKAPLRIQDIQLVVVGSAGNQLASYKLGRVLLASAWLNPVGGELVITQLQAAGQP
ncbi:tyrosinase superfamily [Chlorella sorokiniana]|uniref:Tyrosinase superfamily n=1 Tax=Chlorella sorokiniana TaxID=3076 RepID=A0A2P6U0E0_CHLSO|nr:tyrosinase superfamily [Chlorella sorokiniana]|eukprot:PRW59760.1 tyrosinase superfamily [Chlorella sorokiniana]